jgi:hypothetical protein
MATTQESKEKVYSWRLGCLLEAGWPFPLADDVAGREDVDLHRACSLVDEQKCDPELAAEILL